MDRVGNQTPTVSVVLPYTETRGQEAVDLNDQSENTMMERQAALMYDIMAVDPEGLRDFRISSRPYAQKNTCRPGGPGSRSWRLRVRM